MAFYENIYSFGRIIVIRLAVGQSARIRADLKPHLRHIPTKRDRLVCFATMAVPNIYMMQWHSMKINIHTKEATQPLDRESYAPFVPDRVRYLPE